MRFSTLKTGMLLGLCICIIGLNSCVSKKKFLAVQENCDNELKVANNQLSKYEAELKKHKSKVTDCEQRLADLELNLGKSSTSLELREEQLQDLRDEIEYHKKRADQQVTQVEDLTVLSKSANDNIKETLSQLEGKDKYLRYLQAAKTKTDSLNLALAVNLKGVLQNGIDDSDIEVKVDKTVVFVNLSDKMLFTSGSSIVTPAAKDVLNKIAKIIISRPDLELMVEGYTDNVPVNSSCMQDNWDLSVKRATAVVRILERDYNVDPNRLIAAGRGEYNVLASNATLAGRSMNRRTRIILLPKLDQFYDLLDPEKVPK